MSKLKRCPFCGDEVEIAPTGLCHWKYAICHKSKTECILDANAFAIPYEEEDAVRMWNTRAEPKDEPQTDGYMTAEQTVDYRKMLDNAENKVYGNIFEDEPQTETSTNNSTISEKLQLKDKQSGKE